MTDHQPVVAPTPFTPRRGPKPKAPSARDIAAGLRSEFAVVPAASLDSISRATFLAMVQQEVRPHVLNPADPADQDFLAAEELAARVARDARRSRWQK